jgi:hypothetical protein
LPCKAIARTGGDGRLPFHLSQATDGIMRIHFLNRELDFGGPAEASGTIIVWEGRYGDLPEQVNPPADLQRINADRGETVPARTEVLCSHGGVWWGARVADEE